MLKHLAFVLVTALLFLPCLASADPPEPQPAGLILAATGNAVQPDGAVVWHEVRAANLAAPRLLPLPLPDTVALRPPALNVPALPHGADPGDDGSDEGAEAAHGPPVRSPGTLSG